MFWSEIFGIGLLASLFTIVLALLALVDILKNEFTGYNKLIWVIVVILLPLFGSILYFVIGTNQKITKQESKQEAVTEKEKEK
jgi:Ca2+/H+ antiporter